MTSFPFPISFTFTDTGAPDRCEGKEGGWEGQGVRRGGSLSYLVLPTCLKLLNQALIGSHFKIISNCVTECIELDYNLSPLFCVPVGGAYDGGRVSVCGEKVCVCVTLQECVCREGCKGMRDHVAFTPYDPVCRPLDRQLQQCICRCAMSE